MMMECKLLDVCILSKGAEKKRFNLKMIQKVKGEPFISR